MGTIGTLETTGRPDHLIRAPVGCHPTVAELALDGVGNAAGENL
jgi:hypothetical protein